MKMTIEALRALAKRADHAFRVDESYAVAVAEAWHRRAAVSGTPDAARDAKRARERAAYHSRKAARTPEQIEQERAEKRARNQAAYARRKAAGGA